MTMTCRNERRDACPEVSVVMPCLNEAATLGACIELISTTFEEHQIYGEVVVADNGSSDSSPEIARALGARVVPVAERGYGNALIGGIEAALGKFVIMGDADCSYDFAHIPRILETLRAGDDLVMGNRSLGGIKPGCPHPTATGDWMRANDAGGEEDCAITEEKLDIAGSHPGVSSASSRKTRKRISQRGNFPDEKKPGPVRERPVGQTLRV
jgi:glycosyltransferase involved in cell wall biosynthesis